MEEIKQPINLNTEKSHDIFDHVPFPSIRPAQKTTLEAIQKWLLGPKKFFILEGPTGFGKSLIGIAAASFSKTIPTYGHCEPGAYILTPQKILQTQYLSDFACNGLLELKGKSNYFCKHFDMDCESASLVFEDFHNRSVCSGYYPAKDEFVNNPLGVTNFAYYLSETTSAHQLPDRTLLVIDEGHNCFPKNSKVTTSTGGKFIQDVRVGDLVLCFYENKFQYKPVVSTWNKGEQPIWLIRTKGGGDIRCTADHRLLTQKGWIAASKLTNETAILGRHFGNHVRRLNEDQLQLVIGSYLGDGWLNKVSNGYRLRWTHGIAQENYCRWKSSLIGGGYTRIVEKNGYASTPAIVGATGSFTLPLRHKHSKRKKQVPQWMLQKLGAKALAIWFMDDGSGGFNKKGEFQSSIFHTESFTKKTCENLQKVLLDKFGIKSVLQKSKNKYWSIRLNKESSLILKDIILPYMHCELIYKLGTVEKLDTPMWDTEEPPSEFPVISARPLRSRGGRSNLSKYKISCYDLEVKDAHNFVVRTNEKNEINKWGNCGVIAHNCEDTVLGFTDILITQKKCDELKIESKLPLFPEGNVIEAKKWLEGIFVPAALAECNQLRVDIANARQSGDMDKRTKLARKLNALENFLERVNLFLITNTPADWFAYSDWDEKYQKGTGDLIIKPLTAKHFAEEILFSKAQKILIMSATILDFGTFMRNLGIDPSDAEVVAVDSEFPVENRPIFFKPIGDMKYSEIKKTLPIMAPEIERLLVKYEKHKGIVHTQSFSNNKYFTDYLRSKGLGDRVLTHAGDQKGSRDFAVENHYASTSPTVLFSPSMQEGLDLKDDLSRFQIICKVPWPPLTPYIKARMLRDPQWYTWLASLKLVQSTGRSVRSKTDKAITWILDSGFGPFLSRAKKNLPKWWLDSIIDTRKL